MRFMINAVANARVTFIWGWQNVACRSCHAAIGKVCVDAQGECRIHNVRLQEARLAGYPEVTRV
jgi:hypothetical protein